MSKGRNLTKRKWKDFRKYNKWPKIYPFPRNMVNNSENNHMSMKASWFDKLTN